MLKNSFNTNGIINIYKEKGFTSHDVVAKLRGILHTKKIGHTGTLDPDATGVLPVCINKATKLCDMIADWDKTYKAVMILGVETDTEDTSGQIIAENDINVTEAELRDIILSFKGDYAQVPPMYSAKKYKGKKLYELARQGITVELAPCDVTIHDIDIISIDYPRVCFMVKCSKGTYIRSLCRDIGKKAGCGACMEELVRTRVDSFSINDALTLDAVSKLRDEGHLDSVITPIDRIFSHETSFVAKNDASASLYNGNPVSTAMVSPIKKDEKICLAEKKLYRIYDKEYNFIGLYKYKKKQSLLKPEKLFFDINEMKHIKISEYKLNNTAVALGKFDGLHLGHKMLIDKVLEQKADGYQTVVFTFDKPPISVINDDISVSMIYTPMERTALIAEMGIDVLVEHPFTKDFMSLSPEGFVRDILINKLDAKIIVVGKDFRFAKDRSGDVNVLKELSSKYGYELIVMDKLADEKGCISSTRIRKLLTDADMESTAKLLGRPYTVIGEVVEGNKLGRTFGVPTANMVVPSEKLIPPHGVYASHIYYDGNVYKGITNVGVKPTVWDKKIKGIETHIFDFDEEIYGKTIRVELIHYLRPEMKFGSVDELIRQMNSDIEFAKNSFKL